MVYNFTCNEQECFMPQSSAMRIQKHRNFLRASGLRPIQIWVPDTRRKGFQEECNRQSKLLLKDSQERDILEWIDSISNLKQLNDGLRK